MPKFACIQENEMIRLKVEANEKLIQEQQLGDRCMELMKRQVFYFQKSIKIPSKVLCDKYFIDFREFNSENTHPFTKIMKNSKVHKDTWYSFIPETKFVKY